MNSVYAFLWLGGAVVSGASCLVGHAARQRGARWPSRALAVLVGTLMALVTIAAAILHADGVGIGQWLFGLVAGVVGLAVLPALAFYTLGWAVRGPLLAGLLWFGATFLFAPYVFGAYLLFAFGVACADDCLS